VKKVEGVKDVTTTMEEGTPELVYALDRTRLSNYGMVTAQAAMALQAGVDGQVASVYRESGDEFDIRVRLREADRNTPKEISNSPLSSPLGFSLPIRDVSHPYFTQGPVNIKRENSKRVVTVEANKTDRPLGLIVADIEKVLPGVVIPEGYFVDFGGERKDQMEAFEDLAIMFALGVLLIYMVIASLYESLIHPFTIMVPAALFSFTGAVIGLYLTNTGFGVTAFIGIIMLIGIVATNSIVFVDFILEYHRQGMERRQAIIEAGRTRLRPILMTALTTLFGVLPIALGRAEGMEMQQPLGIVVVGGLCSSTFLTLIIIPSVYEVMDQLAEDLKSLFRRKKPEPSPEPSPGGGGGGGAG
jgi:HAE1 family hydrophobic/amphiphilic exporter-1